MILSDILKVEPNFLSLTEAQEAAQNLRALRENWTPLGSDPKNPYIYYFGAANYLDTDLKIYQQRRDFYNPILEKYYSGIFQKLIQYFSSYFEVEVIKPVELGWPGFHIYHGITMPNGGRIHWDINQHFWVYKNYNSNVHLSVAYSFTLPIELTEGSGLNIWNLRIGPELEHLHGTELRNYANNLPCNFVQYEVGNLYFFQSNYLHQVAPNSRPVTEKRRITLQGHLLKQHDGKYLMFW